MLPNIKPLNYYSSKRSLFIWLVVTGVVIPFGLTLAANVNFPVNTTASLTSPAINFTIIASSTADIFVVNATSVVVTISSSTGGNFSLTSASRDLSIASSSSGGTVAQTCTSGVASTTISQSTGSSSYTITPTSSACAITISNVSASVSQNSATITWTTNYAASSTVSYGTTVSYGSTASDSSGVTSHSVSLSSLSYSTTYHYSVSSAAGTTSATSSDATFTTPGSTSGGGGGGQTIYGCLDPNSPSYNPSANFNITSLCAASSTTPRSTATSSANTLTPSITTANTLTPSITTQQSLQVQLNALLVTLQTLIAQAKQRGISLPPGIGQVLVPTTTPVFSRDLSVGSGGDDVKSLQLFLIQKASGPLAFKLSNIGTTGFFGKATAGALKEYQKSIRINPTGYFGSITREYILSGKKQ